MPERAESLGRLIARTLLAEPRALMHVALWTLLAQLVVLPLPLLSRAAIDRAMGDGAPSMLTAIVLAIGAIAVFDALVTWCRARATLVVEAWLELGVSRTLLERIVTMPFRMLLAKTHGEVLQSFDGMGVARELLATRAAGAVYDVMTTVAITTMMLVVAPRAALAVVACAVASTLVTVVFAHLQRGFQEHETAASVAQHNAILEMLRSIVRVKAAAAESRFVARWRALLGREMAASLRRTRAAVWPEAAATLVRDGLAAAILIWGALRARDSGVTVGALVAFLQMAAVTLAAASRLADVWGAVVTAAPQLAAAREVLAMPLPEQRSRRARAAALRVVVDDVTFRYRHDLPDVIEHVAMLIEPGETRRIEGPSGSGKSTLLRLMAGVLEPDRGSVRIAGARPSQLAGEVMYVPQFARLFSGTLAENLTLLSGGAPLPRIRAVAEELGLGTLLRTMPAGYDTMLHANGTGISSGQRQLILLTAAASSERRVLLLDEPMANLDTATQQRILAARAFAGKTIVYASHTAAW